jgi:hypothetical protein
MRVPILVVTVLSFGGCLMAQSSDGPAPDAPASEDWNLYYQATSIGQNHGTFNSPYTGPLSLQDYREDDVSLTTTLFFDARLTHNLQFVFDPEIAGGRGFSGVDGLANPSNGELPRVATASPKPYIARLYLTYDFGFGSETEHVESDDNQLAGDRPMVRYTITAGRCSLTDFFDNNAYTHDPRSQFMAWAVMYNGAWDYPADTRGVHLGMGARVAYAQLVVPICQRRRAHSRQRGAIRPAPVSGSRHRFRRGAAIHFGQTPGNDPAARIS